MSKIRTWVESCPIEELVELRKSTIDQIYRSLFRKAIELDGETSEHHVKYCVKLLLERVREFKQGEIVSKIIDFRFENKIWKASEVLNIKELEDYRFTYIAEGCKLLAEKRGYKNPQKYYTALMNEALK